MSVESKLYSLLSTATAVTALVSTNIFPEHFLQGGTLPGIVYRRAPGSLRVMSLSGYDGLENARMELSVYSTSIDERRQVADALITVLEAATAFTALLPGGPMDEYIDEIGAYRRALEFSIWNKE